MRPTLLPPADAVRLAELAAARLAEDPRVRLVYLFGSSIDPHRPAVRDIDLAILTDPALSLDDLTRLSAALGAETGAPIDLVSMNAVSIVLAWEIADSGRCLFARSPDAEVEWVTRARSRYWDFKPLLDEQWRLTGERMAERLGGPAA